MAVFDDLAAVMLLAPATTDDGHVIPAGSTGTVVGDWGGEIYIVEFVTDAEPFGTIADAGVDDLWPVVERGSQSDGKSS